MMAIKCNSFSAFKNGKCSEKPIPMGIMTPNTARGNFYLQTNEKKPFGMKLGEAYQNVNNTED